jgi:hypothetical protein
MEIANEDQQIRYSEAGAAHKCLSIVLIDEQVSTNHELLFAERAISSLHTVILESRLERVCLL